MMMAIIHTYLGQRGSVDGRTNSLEDALMLMLMLRPRLRLRLTCAI